MGETNGHLAHGDLHSEKAAHDQTLQREETTRQGTRGNDLTSEMEIETRKEALLHQLSPTVREEIGGKMKEERDGNDAVRNRG